MEIEHQIIYEDEKSKKDKRFYIHTKFKDGSVGIVDDPMTSQEVALWKANRGYA